MHKNRARTSLPSTASKLVNGGINRGRQRVSGLDITVMPDFLPFLLAIDFRLPSDFPGQSAHHATTMLKGRQEVTNMGQPSDVCVRAAAARFPAFPRVREATLNGQAQHSGLTAEHLGYEFFSLVKVTAGLRTGCSGLRAGRGWRARSWCARREPVQPSRRMIRGWVRA